MGMGGIGMGSIFLLLIFAAIHVVIFGPVVKKAGFSYWWSLVLLIPFINLLMIWLFAFMEWPAERNEQREVARD